MTLPPINLPNTPSCPPSTAKNSALSGAYRLLRGTQPAPTDWLSHQALGKPLPAGVCPCEWASISLMSTLVAAKKLAKLPNFQGVTTAAVLDIPAGAGVHESKKNHINFWPAPPLPFSPQVVYLANV